MAKREVVAATQFVVEKRYPVKVQEGAQMLIAADRKTLDEQLAIARQEGFVVAMIARGEASGGSNPALAAQLQYVAVIQPAAAPVVETQE